jgi:predicted adenylyl cyclase CyaB
VVRLHREIEAKILGVDEKRLKARLLELGAKRTFSGTILTTYFDFPTNALALQKTVLRLRKTKGKATMCVKTKPAVGRLKKLNELEVSVDDFEEAAKILAALGFVEKERIEKKRNSFQLGSCEIELDRIGGLPLFAEIEGRTERDVLAAAKRLGFSQEQLLPWNTFQVLEHYRKKGCP